MPKHSYITTCDCARCERERARRAAQSAAQSARNRSRRSRRRAKIREEYWDAWESGRPEWDTWPMLDE
jgi:hypothetical protein